MKYKSTRGGVDGISFSDAVMMGLAEDRGLLIPEQIPEISEDLIKFLKDKDYIEVAFNIIKLFVDDIGDGDLRDIIHRSYSTFNHEEIVPVEDLSEIRIMELFYGPTFAFKDVALQFLGNLFEYLLDKSGQRLNILGATSGDTGSAAIYGVRGKKNMNIFILFPYNRVSKIQELQMTTVEDKNVFSIAIEGTFDDCQRIVKEIFSDLSFKKDYHLGAVNSINWARIVAQVVYYIWGVLKVEEKVVYSVPTGNFGNIFAGFMAKRMLGERISKLVLATNENDILTRFVVRGDYSIGKVVPTISPSMDIQVASNFERYLYYLYNGDTSRVRESMEVFAKTGKLTFDDSLLKRVREDFWSFSVTQEDTLDTMRYVYDKYAYILDPHTAVGVKAAMEFIKSEKDIANDGSTICLATAHPAKFPEAVRKAIGKEPEYPEAIRRLFNKEKRFVVLPAETDRVKEYIAENAI